MAPQVPDVASLAPASDEPGYQVDDLIVDPGSQQVRRAGTIIPLPALSFDLLVALARAAPNLLTFEQLGERVWPSVVATPETIIQRVKLVRNALGDDPHAPRYIEAVRGRGYRMVAHVRPLTERHGTSDSIRALAEQKDEGVPRVQTSAAAAGAAAVSSPSATPPAPGTVATTARSLLGWIGGALIILAALAVSWAITHYRGASKPAALTVPAKSIAVLPFVDMSEMHDQEYFSDGLSEELIDLLTKVSELRVPARTSSFYFKGKPTTIADIAKALNVAHILEGSVRKSGNTVRITAQLVRVDNGYHVWSQTYDRDLNDIFRLQDEIASSVVQALKVKLLAGTPRSERATTNLEAYNLLLQGRFLNGRFALAEARQAATILERALALDPTYAPAWAELSQSYWFLGWKNAGSTGAEGERARTTAERAVALDPTSAAAHDALATAKIYDSDWQGAAAEYAAARKADPDTPYPNWVPLHLGCVAGPCYDNLIRDVSRQIDRDPLNARYFDYRAHARYYGGDLQAAEGDARRALELSPDLAAGHTFLVKILIARHELDSVLATAALELTGPNRRIAVALAYEALGQRAEADRALQDLVSLDPECAFEIAMLYAVRRDNAAAFDWLERAHQQHDYGLASLKIEPPLMPLRGDPRFKALLRKMNLPQ